MFAALTQYLSLIEYGHVKFSYFGHVAETSHCNIAYIRNHMSQVSFRLRSTVEPLEGISHLCNQPY